MSLLRLYTKLPHKDPVKSLSDAAAKQDKRMKYMSHQKRQLGVASPY